MEMERTCDAPRYVDNRHPASRIGVVAGNGNYNVFIVQLVCHFQLLSVRGLREASDRGDVVYKLTQQM
jgi:hypothetical protein